MTAYRGGESHYGVENDPHARSLTLSGFTPVNYTPSPADAVQLALLSAHLRGIDNALAALAGTPAYNWYSFFSRCSNGSGSTLSDQSLNLNNGTISVTTNSWGNAGKFTTTESGASNQAARLSVPLGWDMRTDSLIIAMQLDCVAPASATHIIGNTTGTAAGFSMRAESSGLFRMNVADGTNQVLTLSDTTAMDGAEHTFVLAVDGVEKLKYCWIDGVIDSLLNGVSCAAVTGSTAGGGTFSIGSAASSNAAAAAIFDNVHVLRLPNRGLPSDMASLVAAFHAAPDQRFTVGQLL